MEEKKVGWTSIWETVGSVSTVKDFITFKVADNKSGKRFTVRIGVTLAGRIALKKGDRVDLLFSNEERLGRIVKTKQFGYKIFQVGKGAGSPWFMFSYKPELPMPFKSFTAKSSEVKEGEIYFEY